VEAWDVEILLCPCYEAVGRLVPLLIDVLRAEEPSANV